MDDEQTPADAPTVNGALAADEETIDLLAYAQRLLHHLVPALVLGLVAMVALGALALLKQDAVHMRAHVLVQPTATRADQAQDQAEMLSRAMFTYMALEDLPALTQDASSRTEGRFTPQQVVENTEVYWGGGSLLLAVTATADSEEDARLLANAMAAALAEKGPGLLGTKSPSTAVTMSVLEQAAPDPEHAPTGLVMKVAPAVAAGMVVTLLGMVVLEAMATRRERRHPRTQDAARA